MLRASMGFGPMSSEAIEAVFNYSHQRERPLMLVTSKNQIDYGGGYVNNWNTKQYAAFLDQMRCRYPAADVTVCRDHCGPGFNGRLDLEDTYRTIEVDIEAQFQLIHIDFCHQNDSKAQQMEASKRAIQHCLQLNPSVMLEVGTDDTNCSGVPVSMRELREEVAFFRDICEPTFYVVNTGALVKEMRQVGAFNKGFALEVAHSLRSSGIRLKEHQGDYLGSEELKERRGIVDAMNVAPQLGAVQTSVVLHECLRHGIEPDEFIAEVFAGNKWRKWMLSAAVPDPRYCARVAGHYHFGSDTYKRLADRLNAVTDIHKLILDALDGVIERYDSALATDRQ